MVPRDTLTISCSDLVEGSLSSSSGMAPRLDEQTKGPSTWMPGIRPCTAASILVASMAAPSALMWFSSETIVGTNAPMPFRERNPAICARDSGVMLSVLTPPHP